MSRPTLLPGTLTDRRITMPMPPECIELLSDADFNNLASRCRSRRSRPRMADGIVANGDSRRCYGMGYSVPAWRPGTRCGQLASRRRATCRRLPDDDVYLSQHNAAGFGRICESGRDDLSVTVLLNPGLRRPIRHRRAIAIDDFPTTWRPGARPKETAAGLILDGVMPSVYGTIMPII